jgi:gliding motility-associated-like protein
MLFFYAGNFHSQCNTINFGVTITSNYNGSPTSCADSCDAELTINVTSIGGPFGYSITEVSTGIQKTQSNPIFTNLCGSGNYTVTVTDSSQVVIPGIFWCNSSQGIAINDPLPPSPSFGFQSAPTCADSCDGILQGTGSLGTGLLTLSWPELGITEAPGSNNSFQFNLCSGDYLLKVTDQNGCSDTLRQVVVQPPNIYGNVVLNDASCDGDCDGEATANGIGGNGSPYDYDWEVVSSGLSIGTGSIINNLLCENTQYTLHVTDKDDCPYDTTFTTVDILTISVTQGSSSNASCSYACDGSVTVTPSGGSGVYNSVEWFQGTIGAGTNTGVVGTTNNQLCPDIDYFVKVTDNSLCEGFFQITPITSASAISITLDNLVDLNCNGDGNGSISVTLSGGNLIGGVSTLSPSWSTLVPGSGIIPTNEDQTNLSGGTYRIIAEDNAGCKDTSDYVVNEPTAIFSNGIPTNISCSGLTDGAIDISPIGGTGTLTNTWTGGPFGYTPPVGASDLTALDSGTYLLNVTDDNNCSHDTTFTITTPSPILVNGAKIDVSCYDANDGSIDISPSNSNSSGTICETANENGSMTLTAPAGATFTSVTFASYGLPNGSCGNFTIDPACHSNSSLSVLQTALIGNNSVTITADNGTFTDPCVGSGKRLYVEAVWEISNSFSYAWSGPGAYSSTSEDISALDTGTYDLRITEIATGCFKDTSISINQPDSLSISGTSNDIACNGDNNGVINVTVNGGNSPTWTWSGPNGYSQGGSATNLSGLLAGSYTISVSDGVGCTKDSVLIINEPDVITPIPLLVNDVSCDGLTDGSATVQVVGGTVAGDYIYLWSPSGQNTATATGLAAGTYTIRAEDDEGCFEDSTITILAPNVLSATHTVDADATCNGDSDGEATVTPTGGNGPYTYVWSNGQTGATATGLAAGNYTCQVIDNGIKNWNLNYSEDFEGAVGTEWTDNSTQLFRGETVLGEFNINSTGQPTLNLTGLPAHDSIRIVFDFYAFDTWNGNNLTFGPDLWNLSVDGVSLLNTTFCKDAFTAQAYPDDFPASNTGLTAAVAFSLESLNYNSGGAQQNKTAKFFINQSAVHNANSATIALSDQLVQDIDNDSWGIDNIKIFLYEPSGIAACTYIENVTINQPDILTATASKVSDVVCNDELNGVAQAVVNGGSTPYSYLWSNGSTSNPVTNLGVGNATVEITDSAGCQVTSNSVTINEPTVLSVSISSPPTFTGYQYIGEYNNQYIYYHSSQMTWPNARADCQSNGGDLIVIKDSLDNASYSNVLTGAGWIGLFQNTFSANYSEPFGGWEWIDGTTLDYNDLNGTPNETIDWSGYQNWNNPVNGGSSNEPNDFNGGPETYGQFVSNPGFYLWNDLFEVQTRPFYMVLDKSGNNVTNVSCFGGSDGSALATAVGGDIINSGNYSYSWSPTGQITALASGLSAGEIIITVTDDNGCIARDTAMVTEPPAMNLTAAIVNVTCNGIIDGSITLNPSGGSGTFEYDWDIDGTSDYDDSQDLLNIGQGTYILSLRDAVNTICTIDTSFTIIEPDAVFVGPTTIQEISCAGDNNGSITISPFGGTTNSNPYIFDWNNDGTGDNDDTQNLTNLGGGVYEIKIIDDVGCEKDSTININTITAIQFNPTVNNSNCGLNNGNISVAVTGGNTPYIYSWDNGGASNTINSVFQGTYVLTLSYTGNDGSICSVDTTFILTDNPPAIDAVFTSQDESCFGTCDGSIAAVINSASNPVTYNWTSTDPSFVNDGNANQFNLCDGTYFLDMVDGNLCPYKDTLIVSSAAEIIATETITNIDCGGDSTGAIAINVTGGVIGPAGYQYSWVGQNTGFTSNSININNLVPDNYFLTVTDDVNCSDTATYPVVENNTLSITQNVTPASCGVANGAAAITVIGGVIGPAGYQTIWKDNSAATIATNTNNINAVAAGIYTVFVTDDLNCQDSVTVNINDLSLSSLSVDSIKHESCAGDADGLITVSLVISPPPYTLTWTGPAGFTDPGGNNTTINNLANGQYIATLTDGAGCALQEVIDINQAQSLTVNDVTESPNCFGENTGSIDLFVSGGSVALDYTYDWDNDGTGDNDDTQDLNNLIAGSYSVIISDDIGCSITTAFLLSDPTELTGTTSATLTGCGLNDGTAQVNVVGGTVLVDYTYSWTDGSGLQISATNSVINQPGGCYNVDVTDDNGCLYADIVCINNPTGPTISLDNIDSVSCYGNSDGSIFVTTSGVNIPFTFDWQIVTSGSADNLEDLQNVNQGTYSITVTDTLDCITGATYNVEEPDSIQVNFVKTDLSCFQDASGEIDVTITGGSLAYTLSWAGPGAFSSNSQDLTGLIQGSYSISGTDFNGCTIPTTNINIIEPTLMSISLDSTNTACNQPTGSVSISGIGGTIATDYTYKLTDLAGATISTSATTQNLAQGQYIGYIFDDSLCSAFDTIEVVPAASPQIVVNDIEHVDCAGNSTGSIYITVTGSATPFNYQWSGSVSPDPAHQTVEDFENWFAGIYSVTVTDTNGCFATEDNLTINQPATLFSTENTTNPQCAGENTGSIVLVPSGGTLPYTFEWSKDGITIGNSGTINNLDSGSYVYLITDSSNCIFTNTVNITPPNALSLIGGSTQSTCGNTDGSATVTASGGTAPTGYNYSWSSAISGTPIAGSVSTQNTLNSGIYKVVVSDDFGCSDSLNITVSDSDGPVIAYNSSNIACFGSINGTIDLTITGTPIFNYVWTGPVGFVNPGNIEDLNGLDPGNYSVFVTDGLGCSSAENIVVNGPSGAIQVQSTIKDLNFFNDASGEIAINVIGGTPGYTFSWTGPNGFVSSDEDLVGLDSGQYVLDILDDNLCPLSGTVFDIIQPTIISLDTSIVQPTCDSIDGILSVVASGGVIASDYTYVWDDISTPQFNKSFTDSLLNIGAGNYEITVTDDQGCSANEVIAISDLNGPVLSEVSTDVDCVGDDDGTIDLTISPVGTYSIDWDNDGVGDADDNEDLINLSAGNYNVVVEDLTSGCKSSLSVNIDIANTLAINLTPTSLDCNSDTNGSIATIVTGGSPTYDFDWTLGGFSVSSDEDPINLSAGNYILTLTDGNGCQKIDSAEITEPTAISLNASSINSSCGQADGTVSVIALGGTISTDYNYSWFEVGGGFPGNAVGNTATVNSLVSGSYQVLVSDDKLCQDSIPVAISDDNAPSVSFSVTDVECFGDSTGVIDLTVVGIPNFSYSWTGPNGFTNNVSDSITELISGNYTVVVTDGNLCTRTKNIVVDGPLNGLSLDSTVTPLTCNGDSTGAITIQINGGTAPFQTIWSGPSGYSSTNEDLVSLDTGTYSLLVIDSGGCQLTNNFFEVTQPDSISIAETISLPTCNALDGSISVTAGGGLVATNYQYLWDNLSAPAFGIGILPSLSNIGAGNYQITVTDDFSCTSSKVFSIANANAPTLSAVVTDIDCNGNNNGSIDLTVTGTSSYTLDWDNDGVGDADDNEDLTGLSGGTYSVTVNDLITGCVSVLSENIIDPNPISIGSTVSNILCNGNNDGAIELFLAGGTGDLSPLWTTIIPGNGIITNDTNQTGLAKGTYKVLVSDFNNCKDSVTYNIEESDTISISSILSDVQCADSINGSINVNPIGGTGILIASWSSTNPLFANPGTFNINTLDSGSYSLNITDSNSCNFDTTFNLVKPSSILTLPEIQHVSCFGAVDGEIALNIIGGNGGFSTSWTGPNAYSSLNDTIISLDTGSYILNIVDLKGCTKDTSVIILQPNEIDLSAVINNVACFGDLNGKINISVSGGTLPFSYDWDTDGTGDFDDDDSVFNLSSGNYSFSLLDSNNCSVDSIFNVVQPSAITISAVLNNNLCFNDSLGSILPTQSGGTGTINYTWTSPSGYTSSSDTITLLHSDTFNLSLIDSNQCLLDTFFVISSATKIEPNLALIDANCGLSDGSAEVIPSGGAGVGTYTFIWKDASNNIISNTNNVTAVSAGNYSVSITDSNNCSADTIFTISNTSGPIISVNNITNTTCFEGSDGSIDVSITGGNQPYSIYWNPNHYSQTSVLSNVGAGNHIVKVIDSVGCEATDTITVGQPPAIIINTAVTNTNCGVCSGSATATVSGGNPSSTFNPTIWSDGSVGNLASGLCSGVYSVAVSDNLGCSFSQEITVSSFSTNITETVSITPPSCNDLSDGSITVSVSGGVAPYSYLWLHDGSSSSTLNNVAVGNYYLMIIDDDGCSKTIPIAVTALSTPISVEAVVEPSNCGLSNGSISLSASGGSGIINFLWANGNATNSLSAIPSGVYPVSISDGSGCVLNLSYGIPDLSPINISLGITDASCSGVDNGSISAAVVGGTGILTENWYGSDGTNLGTGNNISNLSSGNYLYSVSDNNCQLFASANINGGNELFISLSNIVPASCEVSCNASATVVAAGGELPYSYLWKSGGITSSESSLCSGIETILITDANGCELQQNIIIEENNTLNATYAIVDATCNACDGEATVITTGGSGAYSTVWYDGALSNTHNNLCAGVYGLTIKDDSTLCTIKEAVNISNIGGPNNQIVNTVNPTCFGSSDGSASVAASGGTPPYSYLWVPGGQNTQSITNTSAGDYFLEIIDENNCLLVVPVTLSDPSNPSFEAVVLDANCSNSDGAISLIVYGGNGPFAFNWIGPNGYTSTDGSIESLEAGQYYVTITDLNGCLFDRSFTVNNINSLGLSLNESSISCYGGNNGIITSNIISGSGSYTYQWSNGAVSPDISSLSAGSYGLTVTDNSSNCSVSSFLELTEPDSIALSIPIIIEPDCYGDANAIANIIPMGGTSWFNVLWVQSGAIGFSQANLSAGSYDVIVTDLNNCSSNQTIIINQPDSITIIIDQVINAYCQDQNDGQISISANGGSGAYQYNWIDTDGTFSSTNEDISNLFPNTYVITVTDINLCSNTDSVFVDATNTIIASAGIDTNICIGACIDLLGSAIGSSTVSYQWNILDSTTILSNDSIILNYCFDDANNITFELTVTDQNCSDSAFVTVFVNDLPIVDAGEDTSDVFGGILSLGANTGPAGSSFLWTPTTNFISSDDSTSSNPDVEVLSDITYFVTVTDTNGCVNTDDIFVRLIPEISYPSGFSPNADGVNDEWTINQVEQYPNCEVEIYSRWGILLFKSPPGYTEKWDGQFNNKNLPVGTYYYIIELNDPNFKNPITGPVTIIR